MKRKTLLYFTLLYFTLLYFTLLLSGCNNISPIYVSDIEEIQRVRTFIKSQKYIIHAGGRISAENGGAWSYTNSKEALLNCYKNGNLISEIDFCISIDDCLVCTHGWCMMFKNGLAMDNIPMTKDEFLDCKTEGGFTSIWLDDCVKFLDEHPDFYFVTDIKDDNIKGCQIIADFCPLYKDHFIIQIYHASEYEEIRKIGFRNIIYTLYMTSSEEREVDTLLTFAKEHELIGFTYWASPYNWVDIYLERFSKAGYDSFVHTVNDIEEREKYFIRGVSAIYTDIVDNQKY